MGIINRLEPKLGKFAVPGIIKIVAGFQLLVSILILLKGSDDIKELLWLQPSLVMQGEVWRIFTFMFLPVHDRLIFQVIFFLFLTMVSQGIEQAWGHFRTTLFVLSGALFVALGTIIAWYLGVIQVATGYFILEACIVAFGILYPQHTILLFFVLSVKMKYVAMLITALAVFEFMDAPHYRIVIALSFLNLIVWVTPMAMAAAKHRAKVTARRREYEAKAAPAEDSFHRCGVCEKTEHDDPHLEFRVASDGEEYCANCLPKVKERLGQ